MLPFLFSFQFVAGMAALRKVGFALLLVVTLVTAEEKCRTGCQGITPNVFKFAEGSTYKYDYDGKIDLSLSSAEGQHSTTKVKATVLLTQQGQCNQVLRVQNLQIISADNKKYTNIEGIEKPIVLNFHDGHVEDVICTQPSDTQNSLNIKRAVASMFQAAQKHHGVDQRSEIDVFGNCPTEFSQIKEGPFQVIKKTRNLNKCSHRESLKQDFMTTAFDPDSAIKSSPFLQGKYHAELKLKGGIPQVITVNEDYLYVPFSNGDKGAKADVHSQLKFTGVVKENPKVSCNIPRSLIFEDPHPILADKSCVGPILKALTGTANAIDMNVKEDTASRFNLVRKMMKAAPKKDLMAVYAQVRAGAGFKNKVTGRKVFLDALFRARTGDAIEVGMDIYRSNGLDKMETTVFFASLNLADHVTEGALSAAANLVTSTNLPRQGYLGVGALVRKFCRQHSCDNVKGLTALFTALQAKLNGNPSDKEAENVVLATLKAVRNAARVNNPIVGKIIDIAQDKQAPTRLRVGALEAYLADPCNDRFRDSAISIMKDIQLDSELRIKAYLALAQCPNGKVATAVKTVIDNEPSIQVGGFIASHLATLRSSTNPDKALAKAQLGEIRTTKRFPLDFRQYSFNGEYSYNIDMLGAAESVEGNLIYSQKSFIPRSLTLNMSVELFSQRYNFLEVDVRQENLDDLAASYFGPNADFNMEDKDEIIKSGTRHFQKAANVIGEKIKSYKQKREVNKNQVESFAKQLIGKQNSLNKDLDLDLSIRLFGTEMLFFSSNEGVQNYSADAIADTIADAMEDAEEHIHEFDKSITQNFMFMDSEVSYPTSIGFPMRLSVEGTASSQVKASSHVPGKTQYKFSFVPSISVELASRFVIDAAVVESGLTVVGNLYSSLGAAGEFKWTENDFDVSFTLPLEKQELLSLTHNIAFETREPCGAETKTPLKFVQSKDFSVCLDQLKSYVGLTFCADVNQPNIGEASTNVLPYPLNGNSKLSVTILKNDFGRIHFNNEYVASGLQGKIALMDKSDKPKSSIDYNVDLATPAIIFKLASPEISGSFETQLVRTPGNFYGLVRLASNQIEYFVKLGITYSGPDERIVAKPVMLYKAGQGDPQPLPYHMTGQIIGEKLPEGNKYIFDNIKLVTPHRPPIGVVGYVSISPGNIAGDINLDDGQGHLKGKLIIDENINLNMVFNNKFNPSANFDLKYALKFFDVVNVDSKLQFIHGPDLSNKNAIFKLSNSIKYSGKTEEFETCHELSYPGFGIDDKLEVKTTKRSLDFEVRVGYSKVKVGTKLEMEVDKKNKGDLDFEFELYGFDNKLEIDLERLVIGGHRSKIHHTFTFNGKSIDVEGDVKHFIEQHRADIGQDLVIKITAHPDIKWKTELKYTQNDIDTAIKVTCGSDIVLNAFLKADRDANVNGNLKLEIPKRLTANGNIKANKGAGSGWLLVNVVELQRKFKSEAEFKVDEPTYNLDVTFYSNFEKDNTRKYRLVTNNQYKPDSLLESKNTLELLGDRSVFNIKLGRKGEINDLEEIYEAELIFPNEQYFAGKLHRHVKNNKGAINGQGFLTLEQRPNKNAPGKTLTLKGIIKDLKPADRTFDLTYTLALDDEAGQTLNGDLALKKTRNANDESQIDYTGKLYGTAMSETLQVNLISNYNAHKADYKLSGSYGKGATVNAKAKCDINSIESKLPTSIEVAVDILTPNSIVRIIKYTFQAGVNVLDAEKEKIDLNVATSLYVDDDGKEQGATIDVKYAGSGQISPTEGFLKETLTLQKQDPYVSTVKYAYEPNKKILADVSVKYSKDHTVRVALDVESPNNETYNFDLQLETPIEKAKKVRLHGQFVDSKDIFKSESTLSVDDVKYVEKIYLDFNDETPSLDFEVVYPTGKTDKLYAKILRMDDYGFASEGKIIFHVYDFTLDTNTDIVVHSYEDFVVKMYTDCPKLNINKVNLVANTKEAGGSKKLQVNIKQAGKVVVDATTTYKLHKEEGKIIIDGSGTATVNGEKKSGNFKVTYRELTQHRDKEGGGELTINAIVGTKAFDIEYILTEKHFKYLTSYCVEKKECAHIEIERKEPDDYTEVLVVNLDLRPLGVSHEFGLKSESDLKKMKYALDVHVVNNQHKYQYSELILPTQSHFTLTTPKRVVSLESVLNKPKDRPSPISGYVVLYLNKKAKPQEKTLLEYQLDTQSKFNFNAKLTAPPLKKPLSVSYNYKDGKKNEEYSLEVELNILPNSNKKIIFNAGVSVDDKGPVVTSVEKWFIDLQPLNYKLSEDFKLVTNYADYSYDSEYALVSTYQNRPVKTGYIYKFNRNGAHYQLTVHNKVLYEVLSKVTKASDGHMIIDTEYDVIGCEKAFSHLEIKNNNAVKFEIFRKSNKQNKLQINSGLIPGSIADFRMEVVSPNKKVDLVHGSVKLDESDFGKSDYGINSNNIQEYLVAPSKQLSQEIVKASTDHMTRSFDQAKKELTIMGDAARNNKPDYMPVISYYEEEAKALREEVITDESLKQFVESLDNIVAAVAKVVVEFINSIAKTTEKLIEALHKQSINIMETIEKDVLPKAKEVISAVVDRVLSVVESITQLCFGLLEEVTKFFEAHQAELKQINSALTKVCQDILQFFNKVREQLEDAAKKELNTISDTLKSLPVVDDVTNYIKNALANEPVSEETIATFKAHVDELKDKISFVKVKEFIDVTAAYIEKKMRDQACDDAKEISKIITTGIDAIDELFSVELDTELFNIPVPSKILNTLPEVVVSRLSFVNRLLNGDIPHLDQILETWATLNPDQFFLPLQKFAIVAQGQHIFTFDGKHLTFPGKCSYLLARDVTNNEFSIIGGYANGAFAEITFMDKHDTITIKKNGAVTLNGTPKEFPVRGKKTEALRTYEYIQLSSDVGVDIYCEPDLSLCVFSVSGYYHGHLKGLLGNANAEPYDDYTTAKGSIVDSEADFANSYRIQANCQQVPTVDHDTHHHAESCTKLFTQLSELTVCYPFVNIRNFRQACDHGVAANVPNTEEAIARAYAAACFTKFVPTMLPSEYLKCENSDKPHNLHDTFSVKLPQKAADIVFAIDVNKDAEGVYKELIQPLGVALTKDLADRGIKDVEFHVLTFGGAHPEPAHVTTNQGKMTFKGKMPALTFSEPKDDDDEISFPHETFNFIASMIQDYFKELLLALGFDPQSQAYLEAIDYPFRANAVKAMVAVSSSPCQKSASYPLHMLQKLRAALVRHPSIQLNLITPLSVECSFKVKDDKTTKNVIGFNNKGVFTITDAKKKPTGNPDLLKDLSYDDFCSEYTAGFGGNVFVLDNFNQKNKKLFTSVTSFNIAESLISSEKGMDCICMRDGLFSAKNICMVSYSKEKPATTRRLQKG